MSLPMKVVVSAPKSKNLSSEQEQFLRALRSKLTGAGLAIVEIDGQVPLAEQARDIASKQGVVIVAFSQWAGEHLWRKNRERVTLPTEFNHVTIALATNARRPLLVLREKAVTERGALLPRLAHRTAKVPSSLDVQWLDGPAFERPFRAWLEEVNAQRHVFFGYSSATTATANAIMSWLYNRGLKVLNWKNDFRPGESILSRIEQAADQVTCGLFLFTADDFKIAKGGVRQIPGVNVVFEAGYFVRAKGKKRTLIILEEGTELPADLGGDIYLNLPSRADVTPIEGRLAAYFDELL